MTDRIVVPPIVSATVARALTERHERGGIPGMNRTAALTAVELAQAPVTTPDVVRRVHAWHEAHPTATTPDGRATLLAGVWGGRAGRDWALAMTRTAAAPEQTGPVAAGIAVVAADTGRVLLLQRALTDGDPNGGKWELPGGKLDPGEGTYEAAQREFSEEARIPVPGKLAGGWTSPNGVYQGFVHLVDAEGDVELNVDHEDRHVSNPDDPDGDLVEVVAWWNVDDADGNPVIRPEAQASTPWDDLRDVARARQAAISEPLDILRTIPGAKPSGKRTKVRRLSKRLAAIDRDTRAKLRAGAEVAMASGMRRAGVKVTERAKKRSKAVQAAVGEAQGHYTPAVLAAVGITEQEALSRAFDDYGELADGYLTAAQRAKWRAIAAELDLDVDDMDATYGQRASDARDRAVSLLMTGLGALAVSRLADPHPLAPNEGEVASSLVPGSLVAGAMAAADGRTTPDGTIDPVAPGITFDIVAGDVSDITETLTWTDSGSERPFEPHTNLEGESASAGDYQDVWAKDPGEWPYGTTYWFPGDHEGCGHDWESTLDVPDAGDGAEA